MIKNFDEINGLADGNELLLSMQIIEDSLLGTLTKEQWRQHRLVCEIGRELTIREE